MSLGHLTVERRSQRDGEGGLAPYGDDDGAGGQQEQVFIILLWENGK